jgi:hypothetical protein
MTYFLEVTGPTSLSLAIQEPDSPLVVIDYEVWWGGSFAFVDILDADAISMYSVSTTAEVDDFYAELIRKHDVERRVEDFLLSTDTDIGRMFRSKEPRNVDPDTDAKNQRLDAEERSRMSE